MGLASRILNRASSSIRKKKNRKKNNKTTTTTTTTTNDLEEVTTESISASTTTPRKTNNSSSPLKSSKSSSFRRLSSLVSSKKKSRRKLKRQSSSPKQYNERTNFLHPVGVAPSSFLSEAFAAATKRSYGSTKMIDASSSTLDDSLSSTAHRRDSSEMVKLFLSDGEEKYEEEYDDSSEKYRLLDQEDEVGGTTTTSASTGTTSSNEMNEEGNGNNTDKNKNDDNNNNQSFVKIFTTSEGPPQVVFMCVLLALALGSTVGVVPTVMATRYANSRHGFPTRGEGGERIWCSDFVGKSMPEECLLGSADAQNASALASFFSNGATFLTSSFLGSLSDEHGRRGFLLLGVFLSLLAPTFLVLIQIFDDISANWYFVSSCVAGLINWISISLSALSDVLPKKWRAPSFGVLLAGFMLGFAFAPLFALGLGHFGVSVMSLCVLLFCFFFALFKLPETLPESVSREAKRIRTERYTVSETEEGSGSGRGSICRWCRNSTLIRALMRPMKELSILNRSSLFRLLSALAFFSGMSSAGDQNLFIYYAEERLAFDDHDVAKLFLIIGLLGILVQGAVLKPLNDLIGERMVIVVAFMFGMVHNVIYGLARDKTTLFCAVALSSFTGMAFPTISAIKSNNVEEHEQGRIQGALYSVSSLASALGPMSLRFVYHQTKDFPYPGPGSMFLFGAFLYLMASCCAFALPKESANASGSENNNNNKRDTREQVSREGDPTHSGEDDDWIEDTHFMDERV